MNFDVLTEWLKNTLTNWLHIEWLSVTLTVVISVIITAVVAHLVTMLIKRFLNSDNVPIPSSSIFINIGRVIVWTIGICIIASSCFNINVSAAITALGIGGIAISLGFQDTLSNLIGGLQLSLTGLVEPGDHIEVGSHRGVVHDVTWRHTSIITTRGEHVIIPNSVINKDALKKLPPQNAIRIGVLVDPKDEHTLNQLSETMEKAVNEAVSKVTVLEQKAKVQFSEVSNLGYAGTLSFAVAEGSNVGEVKDIALKSISEYAHKTSVPKGPRTSFLRKRAKRNHKKGATRSEARLVSRERAAKRAFEKNQSSHKNEPSPKTEEAAPQLTVVNVSKTPVSSSENADHKADQISDSGNQPNE